MNKFFMKVFILPAVTLSLLLGFALPAFANLDPTAGELIASGKTFLENKDLVSANNAFKLAVADEPANQEANFFYSITRLFNLVESNQDGADPESIDSMKELFDSIGMASEGRTLYNWTADLERDINGKAVLPGTTPTGAEVHAFLINYILPEIDASLSNLDVVDSGFQTIVTPAMFGTTGSVFGSFGDIEVDYGDILLMRSSLESMKMMIYLFTAYDMDIDILTLYGQIRTNTVPNINTLLAQYPDLLTIVLSSNFPSAKNSLLNVIDDYLAASDFIRNEVDSQIDDMVSIDPIDLSKEADFRLTLNDIKLSLTQSVYIRQDAGVHDPSGDDLMLNLGQFFYNPVPLRDYLPQFNEDDRPVSFNVPDTTMGGALPDFTELDWMKIIGARSASGTYTWNSGAGELAIDTTASDFICDGLSVGLENINEVAVTTDTMTWSKDGIVDVEWTRSISGAAGDIVGVWTMNDPSGSSWSLTVNNDNTFLLVALLVNECNGGGGGEENPHAQAQHWSNGYYVPLEYRDSNQLATSVSVAGPGINGSLALAYDSNSGSWSSWVLSQTPFLGVTYPGGMPYTYTFTIDDSTGVWTADSIVTCFQEQFATNLSPSGTIAESPVFSWTGIGDPGARYGVELNDTNYSRIWSNYEISGTSIGYNGPALTPGETYIYNVIIMNSTACSNTSSSSFAQGSFIFNDEISAGSISGTVSYSGGNTGTIYVALSDIPNITPGVPDPQYFTTISGPGAYTISNVPDGTYYVGAIRTNDINNIQMADPYGLYGVDFVSDFIADPVVVSGGAAVTGKNFMMIDGTEQYPNPFYVGWIENPSNGHQYKRIGCVSWEECENTAVAEGAHLVTINDAGENNWLVQSFGSQVQYCIGFTDKDLEGIWVWASGETSSYTNWGDEEPNNFNDEDYAVINFPSSGRWNDVPGCGVAIIEKGDIEPEIVTLNLSTAGTGTGTVTSDPAGIDCGVDCTESYTLNTSVTLTATPEAGSTFTGWSGDEDCSDGSVMMDAAKSCTATFTDTDIDNDGFSVIQGDCNDNNAAINPGAAEICDGVDNDCDTQIDEGCEAQTHDLTINITGTGSGTVTSDPAGIDCGGDCSESYALNTSVTLTATASEGSTFTGWSGDEDCSDGQVTMDAAKSCTATFNIAPVLDFTPYTSSAKTLLIDHLDGSTSASILAYRETGAACGSPKASATPNFSYGSWPNFLGLALNLNPPTGEPAGSTTYLKYPGGQLLSQSNGTVELWTYLTSYGNPGVSLIEQGPYPGACAGWTYALVVNSSGQLRSTAWAAFNVNSGATTIPLNTWTHVAATWGSTGAKLYINGELVGSDANTGKPASGYGGSVMLNYNAGVGTWIDEVRISNIQRTIFVPDADDDNISDLNDPDDDNDGVLDGADSSPLNNKICGLDTDGDTCDDCSSGTYDITRDGTDADHDGICETDYGDAADPAYPSLRASNGANHIYFDREWLGKDVDGENNSLQINDDERDDGVVFAGSVAAGVPVDIEVTASVLHSTDTGRYNPADPTKRLYLNAWLDWNGDGDWNDAGEKIIGTGSGVTYPGYGSDTVTIDPTVDFEAGKNSATYIFTITPPSDWPIGSYARFRLDYGEDVGITGTAQYGEVEDYLNPLVSSSSVDNTGDTITISDSGSDLDGAVMDIPANALDAPVNITIEEVQNPESLPPTPLGGFALMVDFGPEGTVFNTPVRVTIPHDPALEHAISPQVYYWDEVNQVWSSDGISNIVYDEASNPHTIAFDVAHFSVFVMDMGDSLIDYDLINGWNLISLPRQPRDTSIDTSLDTVSGLYNIVWSYENSEWMMNNPSTPMFNTLETIESGKGYWIYMNEPATLTVSGGDPLNSVPLATGWNLVGYNSKTGQPIADVLASIDGKVISVWAFINNEWFFYAPGNIFSSLETIEPGYGYWINTTEACTWTLP